MTKPTKTCLNKDCPERTGGKCTAGIGNDKTCCLECWFETENGHAQTCSKNPDKLLTEWIGYSMTLDINYDVAMLAYKWFNNKMR